MSTHYRQIAHLASWISLLQFFQNYELPLVTLAYGIYRKQQQRRRLFTYKGRTFSRSYGTILPSSFNRVLSSALGFSPHPPVSVCGTGDDCLKLRGFSWKHGINHFAPEGTRHHISELTPRICLRDLPTCLNRDIQHPAGLAFSVTPSQQSSVQEY